MPPPSPLSVARPHHGLLLFQQDSGFPRQTDEIYGFLIFSNMILQGGEGVPVGRIRPIPKGQEIWRFPVSGISDGQKNPRTL
jgi:hypothetical protein